MLTFVAIHVLPKNSEKTFKMHLHVQMNSRNISLIQGTGWESTKGSFDTTTRPVPAWTRIICSTLGTSSLHGPTVSIIVLLLMLQSVSNKKSRQRSSSTANPGKTQRALEGGRAGQATTTIQEVWLDGGARAVTTGEDVTVRVRPCHTEHRRMALTFGISTGAGMTYQDAGV